jgi:hypothetical protein
MEVNGLQSLKLKYLERENARYMQSNIERQNNYVPTEERTTRTSQNGSCKPRMVNGRGS